MLKILAGLFLGASLVDGAGGGKNRPPRPPIYPEDHWLYSTKLTTDNFNEFIIEHVDAGKTVFVRTIASEG